MWIKTERSKLKMDVSEALKGYCECEPTTYKECTLQIEIDGNLYIKADMRDKNGNRRYPADEIEENLMIEVFEGEVLTDSEFNDIILNSDGGSLNG